MNKTHFPYEEERSQNCQVRVRTTLYTHFYNERLTFIFCIFMFYQILEDLNEVIIIKIKAFTAIFQQNHTESYEAQKEQT